MRVELINRCFVLSDFLALILLLRRQVVDVILRGLGCLLNLVDIVGLILICLLLFLDVFGDFFNVISLLIRLVIDVINLSRLLLHIIGDGRHLGGLIGSLILECRDAFVSSMRRLRLRRLRGRLRGCLRLSQSGIFSARRRILSVAEFNSVRRCCVRMRRVLE